MNVVTRRLFFALWPTPEISLSIKENSDKIKNIITGNYVAQSNWHITLAFLGNVDNETTSNLIEQTNNLNCSSFDLTINKINYFKKTKILYFGVEKNSNICDLNFLVQECTQIQNNCGLKTELKQFTPHITIARKVNEFKVEQLNKINTIVWRATEFVLVSSEQTKKGSVYTVINKWPLTAT